ncbi:hypothetical protein [Thermococcus sp. 21S7]|uniref:hypothetical protein n=1 Tax=Thermococcus sp. 21S7 TaxID=1638221 RepID=UPI003211DA79
MLIVAVLVIVAPIAYAFYGYTQFNSAINPSKPGATHTYIVIRMPSGEYLAMTPRDYLNLTSMGWEPPAGSKGHLINVTGYVTGFPEVDVNMTFRAPYERFTVVLGDTSVKMCSSEPKNYPGSCPERAATVSEITALTSTLFKRYYYWEAIKNGMDNTSAKMYAYEQTMKRFSKGYLTFVTKAEIGLGRMGTKKHLAVVIIGPAEGADVNQITVARPGLVVLEGKSDAALRAEVALIEKILNFKWPENSTATR